MKKKVICIIITISMLLSMSSVAFAEDQSADNDISLELREAVVDEQSGTEEQALEVQIVDEEFEFNEVEKLSGMDVLQDNADFMSSTKELPDEKDLLCSNKRAE